MKKLSVLACQIEIPQTRTREQRDDHVAKIANKIDQQLSKQHADLVVLPELSTIEYSSEAFDNLDQLSDPLNASPCIQTMSQLAKSRGVTIVFGLPRKDDGRYFISIVAINSDGEMIGYYDKIHICEYGKSMEKKYFDRGKHLLVFEIEGIKIAPIICYDIRFPELMRTLCSEHDVDLVLHCGAYARDESYYSWHQFVVTRAMENLCHVVSVNRAGDMFGNSIICPPWVDESHLPIQLASGEEFKVVEIDMQEQKTARQNYSFLEDKLNDYSILEKK